MVMENTLLTTHRELRPDLLLITFPSVNAFFVGHAGTDSEWVLVDTGPEDSSDCILECAGERFGCRNNPQAIILTHGHLDHIGSVMRLSEYWDVPVYAHDLEMPYITGQREYPMVESRSSQSSLPSRVDISFWVLPPPKDGRVPGLSGWKWIHTPGHTDGHISLFRQTDRTLLIGDALTLDEEYQTADWDALEGSIKLLRDLHPSLAVPSHGEPMGGAEFSHHLDRLIQNFDTVVNSDYAYLTSDIGQLGN
jgi:glyoxylase-like metal-dependent hydrolase (beta-lactamase superfamily II)